MNNKCNVNYQSKYVCINSETIHVNDYIVMNDRDSYKNLLRCQKNHEVILVNGQKITPHFRHKHNSDVCFSPMSEWHIEWQSNFPVTEICYPKINETQLKDRRADVLIEEHGIIIELQHSKITAEEVKNRNYDYQLNNKYVLWVIDGSDIIITYLKNSQRYYLDFTSSSWKYESFLDCEFIYIDINSQIFKLNPGKVKSHMIDVQPPYSKELFLESLNKGDDLWEEDDVAQSNLYIKQQGAGNGKTYGIIQNLGSETFNHYENFIFVTKQHSAKFIIYNEFNEQVNNGDLKGLVIDNENEINKKYIINYHCVKGIKRQIIIGTIDSLIYSIGNKNHKELGFFEGLINSIIDEHIETDKLGGLNYGIRVKLNKKTCLIVDETQDLTNDYAKAIIQIMRNRYIDAFIVGDKLQSITYENNAFVYLLNEEFSNIKKNKHVYTNICRRFIDPSLVKFVNSMIPFSNYDLPEVQPYKLIENDNLNKVQLFEGIHIYQEDPNKEEKLQKEIEKIMFFYDKEVNENDYKPEDFLFVTPFTKNNSLMDALQLTINIYWKSRNQNEDEYTRYAIYHKSEEGTSINLSESEKSTRMVSIHTSKGDGRNVVFVIGINEQGLKKFSGESNNLVYDSLFHVAITRMKKKYI